MSKQSDFVVAAFAKLSEEDKNNVKKSVDDYFSSSVLRKSIVESTTVSFGPQGAGCPICGR
jgi:hypothetical protein